MLTTAQVADCLPANLYSLALGIRTPVGNVVRLWERPRRETVQTGEYTDLLATIDSLISIAAYAGETVSRPEACAAAFSVPDGAPLEMALANVGAVLHPGDADKVERWAAERRATGRALRGVRR